MLNVRLKYNFNMMMRVKSLKINLWKGDKPISIDIEGFDIALITKNEFEEFQEKKLKLLHMLEDISTKIKQFLETKDLEKFRNAFEDEKSEGTATNNSSAIKLDDIPLIQTDANNSKKGFFIRLLFKFVYSLNLKIKEGKIKFVVLKDEDLNVSAANIKEYFYQKLDNKVFMSKYECFTIGVDDYLVIDISPNTDYAMLVNIHAD